MRGLQLTEFGGALEPFERPTPVPQGAEILLRVLATGICHTDLHLSDGFYDLGGGKRLSVAARGLKPPIILGHEVVGEVLATGPDADSSLIGQTLLVYPWSGCGHCPTCARGDYNACPTPAFVGIHRPGGYADHVLVPHQRYLVPIGDLSPVEAAPYACSGLTAYGALNKVGVERLQSEATVIIGAGGLGLMALSILKGIGATAVVVEMSPAKREEALRIGASAVIDSAAEDAGEQILAALGQAPGVVIDFVGASATAELALPLLARGGKYVVVGLFGGDVTLALPLIAMRSISIEGSNVGSLAELHDLMALVQAGHLPRIAVGTHSLEEGNAVLAALRAGDIVGRAVLQPQGVA
jgi:propanol-preferring alcohol dehydrogenase